MSKFDNMSNQKLADLLTEMEETHINIRARMLSDFDNMERVEKEHEKVTAILKKRLK